MTDSGATAIDQHWPGLQTSVRLDDQLHVQVLPVPTAIGLRRLRQVHGRVDDGQLGQMLRALRVHELLLRHLALQIGLQEVVTALVKACSGTGHYGNAPSNA